MNQSGKRRPPTIAVTMGDPSGVGPEIAVKALSDRGSDVAPNWTPVVIGDSSRLRRAAEVCSRPLDMWPWQPASPVADAAGFACVDLANVDPNLPFGSVSAQAGQAAYEYISRAVELAIAGEVDAVCTLPLNKEALHAAGHRYPGHTELIAELTGAEEVSMLLDAGPLKVVHVTTHLGLLEAIARIEPELVLRTIERAHAALRSYGVDAPSIAVCGINPHAGENGLFGFGEEAEKIEPAIAQARAKGMNAIGPLPADTAFFRARRGDFDVVVAMYHDQGHGPVKVLGIEVGVNVTLGLPIVRTSVDHGTAFDIAGTGRADERSLLSALDTAALLTQSQLATHRRQQEN